MPESHRVSKHGWPDLSKRQGYAGIYWFIWLLQTAVNTRDSCQYCMFPFLDLVTPPFYNDLKRLALCCLLDFFSIPKW